MAPSPTLASVRGAFRAVTRAVVPAAAELDEAAWRRGEALVEAALVDRPPRVRRQVQLFLRVVGVLSWLRFGRRLERVRPAQACTLLATLERSPLLLLRRGVWGIRTLAFMGFYGLEEVRRSIGYAAVGGGWDDAGVARTPWSDRGDTAPPESVVLVAPPGGVTDA